MSLKVELMKIENINKETLKFFSKAFDPTYQIHTTLNNKIIDFDINLVKDFQVSKTNNGEYFGLDVISILNNDKNYQYEFIKTFSTIINEYGCGICAINSTISVNHLLKIPAIYLILIMVEKKIIGSSEVKIIKLYNFLEITKFISGIFCENLTSQILNLTAQFKDSVQNKSIYFAYESLKSLSTFIPSKTSEKINQKNLANFSNSRLHSVSLSPLRSLSLRRRRRRCGGACRWPRTRPRSKFPSVRPPSRTGRRSRRRHRRRRRRHRCRTRRLTLPA